MPTIRKASEATALTGANVAPTDKVFILDTSDTTDESSGTTKAIPGVEISLIPKVAGKLAQAFNFEYDVIEAFYNGCDEGSQNYDIGKAFSFDGGRTWSKYQGNPVFAPAGAGFYSTEVKDPCVLKVGSTYYMYFAGWDGSNYEIGLATSTDGVTFTIANGGDPVLERGGAGTWDESRVTFPRVVYDKEADSDERWKMLYGGFDNPITKVEAGYAYSSDGVTWTKYASNPVITKGTGGDADNWGTEVFDIWIDASTSPATIHAMLGANSTTSLDGSRIWTIQRATSTDWITWVKDTTDLFPRAQNATTISGAHSAGASLVTLSDTTSANYRGQAVIIGNGTGTSAVDNRVHRVLSTPTTSTLIVNPPLQHAYSNGEAIRDIRYHSLVPSFILKRGGLFVMGVTPFILSGSENSITTVARNIDDEFSMVWPGTGALSLDRGASGEWDSTSAENLMPVRIYEA